MSNSSSDYPATINTVVTNTIILGLFLFFFFLDMYPFYRCASNASELIVMLTLYSINPFLHYFQQIKCLAIYQDLVSSW